MIELNSSLNTDEGWWCFQTKLIWGFLKNQNSILQILNNSFSFCLNYSVLFFCLYLFCSDSFIVFICSSLCFLEIPWTRKMLPCFKSSKSLTVCIIFLLVSYFFCGAHLFINVVSAHTTLKIKSEPHYDWYIFVFFLSQHWAIKDRKFILFLIKYITYFSRL